MDRVRRKKGGGEKKGGKKKCNENETKKKVKVDTEDMGRSVICVIASNPNCQ